MRDGGFATRIGWRTRATLMGGGQRGLGLPLTGTDPTDFFDARAALQGSRPLEFIDHLAIAVLDKALRDFRLYARTSHPRRSLFWENARAFLFDADAEAEWPLTFERICDRFGIELVAARAALRAGQGSSRRIRLRGSRAA
jgi:hypothetical protein